MTDTDTTHADKALIELPEVLRPAAALWMDRLQEAGRGLPGELPDRRQLMRLVACSDYAAGVLWKDWEWFVGALSSGAFSRPVDDSVLQACRASEADEGPDGVKRNLRRCRNRLLVHILWRSLGGADDVWVTLSALSALADALIESSMSEASRSLEQRFGRPVTASGEDIHPVVLAMGKLGGRELNFSSDVDLVFVYTAEGETTGDRQLSAHEYFTRYARQVVNLLDEVTADGFVYRVDTRLRPFGESGPAVVSFSGLETYLLKHGRSWERYAYVKARSISSGLPAEKRAELHSQIIDPFVYRRYLDYGVFESLREMKALIETEVRKRELADNIKLGPGGIREIEFIVQSLQLVRGGADRRLRCTGLRDALRQLGHDRGLGRPAVEVLETSYEFLRRFENWLQAIRDQQTHEVPSDEVDRARIALAMGYPGWDDLATDLSAYRDEVATQFSGVAFRTDSAVTRDGIESQIAALWTASASRKDWEKLFAEHGYGDASDLARSISDFGRSSLLTQIDSTARRRLDRFIPALLLLLREQPSPGPAIDRIFSVLSQVLRRSAYVALLNENPAVLQHLVDLCGQSGYLAREIERFPVLLDELLDPRIFTERISKSVMSDDLEARLAEIEEQDSEGRIETLARFQRVTLFRIAVADIAGKLPIMKVSDRLTELAELVVSKALEVAWEDLASRHGEPAYETGSGRRKAGFGVIAYGKFGGIELSYGSDLDLVFLHDSSGEKQQTDGEKALDNAMFFGRLVRRVVHFLTTQTSSGALYQVDTRLRPSGQSGLLVVSVDGFAAYQEENAWTWEHQALLRSRPVAGSAAVARSFDRIRSETLTRRVHRDRLLSDVLDMRARMRRQLDQSDSVHFDLKQGEGGIGDIEFLVQYLVLKHAAAEPALIYYSDNIRQLGALGAAGVLAEEEVARLQETYRRFRLRSHRLALESAPPLVETGEFAGERELVTSLWTREMK